MTEHVNSKMNRFCHDTSRSARIILVFKRLLQIRFSPLCVRESDIYINREREDHGDKGC